jgi:CheY-like chemotaxis protein
MADKPIRKLQTRHLNMDNAPEAPIRPTDNLGVVIPWVIELRVVGLSDVIQVKALEDEIVLGRTDSEGKRAVHIDMEPYNAYALGVSRQHAILQATNRGMAIRDLNSANGTYLNGGRLAPNRPYKLKHGDHLALGRLELQVTFVVMPSSHEKHNIPFMDVEIPVIGAGQRILLLDDDAEVASAMAESLQNAGFATEIALTVTDALTMVERQMPHAIVMEMILPDRSGLDLVQFVRSREDGVDLPIVVVSSVVGGYQMGQAIDAGVDLFLSKPVGIDELLRGFAKIVPQMSV